MALHGGLGDEGADGKDIGLEVLVNLDGLVGQHLLLGLGEVGAVDASTLEVAGLVDLHSVALLAVGFGGVEVGDVAADGADLRGGRGEELGRLGADPVGRRTGFRVGEGDDALAAVADAGREFGHAHGNAARGVDGEDDDLDGLITLGVLQHLLDLLKVAAPAIGFHLGEVLAHDTLERDDGVGRELLHRRLGAEHGLQEVGHVGDLGASRDGDARHGLDVGEGVGPLDEDRAVGLDVLLKGFHGE